MRSVLVTGAGGFIGAHAVAALNARGYTVHALGRRSPVIRCTFHTVDLMDAQAVSEVFVSLRASHLLHLAWYTEPKLYRTSVANLDWVAATLKLVRAFREAGGERVVAVGTCAEYAWDQQRLPEYALCAPTTLYGAAKDSTRRVIDAYARETGLSFAWGRLFFLYGPGERPGRLVSDAMRALLAEARFATSLGHQRRDFSHVSDVAEALAKIVDCAVTGPVNIASGTAVSIRAILNQIGVLTGRPDLFDFGARPLSVSEPDCIEADIARLRDEVGFYPSYDLNQGLAQTLLNYRRLGRL